MEQFRGFNQLAEYEQQLAELRERYTDSHPAVIALEKRIAQLREINRDSSTALSNCVEQLQ